MRFKLFNILLLGIVANIAFILPSYSSIHFAVSPPATSSWDSNWNGTQRSITGVLPGDFKEDEEIKTPDGSYSNKVYCTSDQFPYNLYIRLNNDLTSGANSIPMSDFLYIYTYANNITFTHEATGAKYNYGHGATYLPFSTDTLVYTSGTSADEKPIYGVLQIDWEHQFKYAVRVPNNQAPGTYTGTITYTMSEIGGPNIYTRTCPVSVTVGDYFRLSVDRGTIDFDKMKPGETKDNVPPEGAIVTSYSNTGNPWYLKISNDSPLSSGPYLIPDSNFIWYGWTDGAGTWYGNGNNYLTLVPELMYASSANEKNNLPNGTNNHLKFKLTIPNGQQGGKYISNVKLTLTE